MTNLFTNQKETDRAIQAAVNQANKVRDSLRYLWLHT